MEDITNKILDIQNHSIYVDALKADYMLDMDILMDYIFDSKNDMPLAYDNRVKEKINHLILSKEELITELIRFIANVNELDHELHIWRKKNENN